MIRCTVNGLFSSSNKGNITFPRFALKHMLQSIDNYDAECIYCYLLFHANYGDGPNSEGVMLHRGQIKIHIGQLMRDTGWKRTQLYELLHFFEQSHLLENDKETGAGCYNLPFYEEHCGHSVRKEERPHTPPPGETQNREKFETFFKYYHFLLHTPPADKESAWKEWQKLSLAEREDAFRNLATYHNSTKGNEHQKLACNYLKSKSFKI